MLRHWRFCRNTGLSVVKAAPRRDQREAGGKEHTVRDHAGELERFRARRGDIDRKLPAFVEYHLRTGQLVQLPVAGDRVPSP